MAAHDRVLGLSVPVMEVLDPALWKGRYAHGILLGALRSVRETSGKVGDHEARVRKVIDEIPPQVIRWHLRAALSELEMKLGVPFGVQVCKAEPLDEDARKWRDYDRLVPRLPYTRSQIANWFRIDLPPGLISIERIRAYYFGVRVWELSTAEGNADLIRIQWGKQGIAHILPTNLGALALTPGGNGAVGYAGVWQTAYGHASPIPDFWAVDYTTGPIANNGEVGHVEAVLADWCYCVAGIKLLNMAALAISKGLTSSNVSLDGVSRSISLAQVNGSGMYGALEKAYDDCTKRIDWVKLRSHKRGLRVIPFGH